MSRFFGKIILGQNVFAHSDIDISSIKATMKVDILPRSAKAQSVATINRNQGKEIDRNQSIQINSNQNIQIDTNQVIQIDRNQVIEIDRNQVIVIDRNQNIQRIAKCNYCASTMSRDSTTLSVENNHRALYNRRNFHHYFIPPFQVLLKQRKKYFVY